MAQFFSIKLIDSIPCGSIYIDPASNLTQVRQFIHQFQLMVPSDYSFIYRGRFEVAQSNEFMIPLNALCENSLIEIKENYRPPPIIVQQSEGSLLGTIYISFNTKLKDLREAIKTQLLTNLKEIKDFQFIDRHNCPIFKNQETDIFIWSIFQSYQTKITIKLKDISTKPLQKPSLDLVPKPIPAMIMISYCHNEASDYAKTLKSELEHLKYDVFLDSDAIEPGEDWSNRLNRAVQNCDIFVCLVTSQYGCTKWTNLEVKYADMMKKKIIPINFLNKWPPDILGIQFCTLHYLSYKLDPIIEEQDISWNRQDIRNIAKKINDMFSRNQVDISPSIEVLPKLFGQKKFILISVHPKQRDLALSFKDTLSKFYDVWCTIETESSSSSTQNYYNGNSSHISIANGISHSQDFQEILKDYQKDFITHVCKADLVILILSTEYCSSRISKQQAFYCELRKKMVGVVVGSFKLPVWFDQFLGTNIHHMREEKFDIDDFIEKPLNELTKPHIQNPSFKYLDFRNKMNVDIGNCVYVIGEATVKTEKLCSEIGRELGKLDKAILVVSNNSHKFIELIANSYSEEKKKKDENCQVLQIISKESNDSYPFAKTIIIGENVSEKITIVSKLFKICILIGDKPEHLYEAENFLWADHIVLPLNLPPMNQLTEYELLRNNLEKKSCIQADDNVSPQVTSKKVMDIVKSVQSAYKARKMKRKLHHEAEVSKKR